MSNKHKHTDTLLGSYANVRKLLPIFTCSRYEAVLYGVVFLVIKL